MADYPKVKPTLAKDCNNCNPMTECKGSGFHPPVNCAKFRQPKFKWMLAEMALAHPTSLNKALSALPFKANLDFYLR